MWSSSSELNFSPTSEMASGMPPNPPAPDPGKFASGTRSRGIPMSAGPSHCCGSMIRNCASPCGRCCFSLEPIGWSAKGCCAAHATGNCASWTAAVRIAVWMSSSASSCCAVERLGRCFCSKTGGPDSSATPNCASASHGCRNSSVDVLVRPFHFGSMAASRAVAGRRASMSIAAPGSLGPSSSRLVVRCDTRGLAHRWRCAHRWRSTGARRKAAVPWCVPPTFSERSWGYRVDSVWRAARCCRSSASAAVSLGGRLGSPTSRLDRPCVGSLPLLRLGSSACAG